MTMKPRVPSKDLVSPDLELKEEPIQVLRNELKTRTFIGDPMVEAFENDFARFCEVKHCIGVRGGTSWPAGSLGAQRTANVLASSSSTRLLMVLSNTTAIVLPSGESANDSRSSDSPVIGFHTRVATSPRQSRSVSELRLLSAYT